MVNNRNKSSPPIELKMRIRLIPSPADEALISVLSYTNPPPRAACKGQGRLIKCHSQRNIQQNNSILKSPHNTTTYHFLVSFTGVQFSVSSLSGVAEIELYLAALVIDIKIYIFVICGRKMLYDYCKSDKLFSVFKQTKRVFKM